MATIMAPDAAAEVAAIHDLVATVERGWNTANGALFASSFAADADYIMVDGGYVQGRDVIAAGHQQIFNTIYRGSHNRGEIQDVRFLRPDLATARVRWSLIVPRGEAEPIKGETCCLMVLDKQADGWRIVSFSNTPLGAYTRPAPLP